MSTHIWGDSLQQIMRHQNLFWARLFTRPRRPSSAHSHTPNIFYPAALRPGDATRGRNWLTGDFSLAGGIIKNPLLHPFQIRTTPRRWQEQLHGFDWLRHLLACNTLAAKAQTRRLIQYWLSQHRRHPAIAWDGAVTARRLLSWSMVMPWLDASPVDTLEPKPQDPTDAKPARPPLWDEAEFHQKLYGAFAQQQRWLERRAVQLIAPLPRLLACIGAAWIQLKFDDKAAAAAPQSPLWRQLIQELQTQILADGGHISRSPAALVDIASDLLALHFAYQQYGASPPPILGQILGRIFPLLRFFSHGDGRLAIFHSGLPQRSEEIAALLAHDRKKIAPFQFAPDSGYRRMTAGSALLFVDTGAPATRAHSLTAHAAPLAIEMSDGAHRIIVNCGTGLAAERRWARAMRLAAAHSCLSFDEAAPGTILRRSGLGLIVGERLIDGATKVSARQTENEGGVWLELEHNGYLRQYGTRVFRRLFLSDDGTDFRGEDMLVYEKGSAPPTAPFSLRFHLHPDVVAKIDREQECFLFTLPNNISWRFSSVAPQGTKIMLDSSLYLEDSNTVRPARQVVLSGTMTRARTQIRWAMHRSPSTPDAPDVLGTSTA